VRRDLARIRNRLLQVITLYEPGGDSTQVDSTDFAASRLVKTPGSASTPSSSPPTHNASRSAGVSQWVCAC
jgi:hypothetical protein